MDRKENKKKPAIRFDGFTEEWKEQVLENEVVIFTGLTYSPKDVTKTPGTLVLRSSNVKKGRIAFSDNVYVNSDVINCDNVKVGDIIVVVRNGSRRLIGKHAVVQEKLENTVIGAFMTGLRPRQSNFINALLDTEEFSKEIEKNLGATINQITIGALRSMSFMFPSLPEQKIIGSFFQNIDNLITLHQKKYDKLVILKKAMLMKMFPKDGTVVPEIRFKGFDKPWYRIQFSNAFNDSIPKNTLSRDKLNYREGAVKNIHYGDILIRYGSILSTLDQRIPWIINGELKHFKNQLLRTGDIVFADAAEDETVGKACVIVDSNNINIVSGLHTIACRPIISMDPYYLGYYINSNSYHHQLLPLMQGTKVLSISKTSLSKTSLKFPKSLKEQQKIGNYFKCLDEQITLHETQLDKLNNFKKACFSKMFVGQD